MSTALHLNVDEYNRMVTMGAFSHLNRRIELVRGEIREMNPAGPLHNDLVMLLTDWSYRTTDRLKVRVTVQTSLELVPQQSCPEPDLMWLQASRYRDRHPNASDVKLVIEVSDSSLQSDLTEKTLLYAESGVIELWIVDVQGRCIHVFRKPSRTGYLETFVATLIDELKPLEPCKISIRLQELFVEE
jgi:Uma2 family endonuclease